jgi:hypothetical protein
MFGILLEMRLSGVTEHKYTVLYGKSQIRKKYEKKSGFVD